MATKLIAIQPIFSGENMNDSLQFPSKQTVWQFDNSLQFTVTGLRIFGVPLNMTGIHSPYLRYWSFWFGRFFFFINVALNTIICMDIINGGSGKVMTTGDWNHLISELNYSVGLVGTNIALFGWTAPKWKGLVQVLHRIEQLNLFQEKDYKMFRRYFHAVSYAFIILLGLVGSGAAAVVFFHSKNIIHPIKILLSMYIPAGSFLFLAVCLTASAMLRIIRQQKPINLNKWQHFYGLTGELTDQINECFGLFLLSTIVMLFVWNVSGLFSALVSFWENKASTGILFTLLVQLIILPFFFALVYVPHCIKKEAVALAARLRAFHPEEDRLHQKALGLAFEILLAPPVVTACSFVDINLSLVPAFLGTILTYIIILFQFKTSDEI